MALISGFYSDAPASRMAVDRDGTAGFWFDTSGTITSLTSGNMATLNNEADDNVSANIPTGNGLFSWGYIFPEAVDLTAYFMKADGSSGTVQTSTNTTNGSDGTWTSASPSTISTASIQPAYRTAIITLTTPVTGINGLRVYQRNAGNNTGVARTLHVYAKPTTLAGQRLAFWHPTLDQPLTTTPAFLDWGDRYRATSASKQVRLKNISTTLTANTIVVSRDALTDTTPTTISQLTVSYGGSTPGATATITSLAPSTISGLITVAQDLLSTTTLGLWAQRLTAVPTSWS